MNDNALSAQQILKLVLGYQGGGGLLTIPKEDFAGIVLSAMGIAVDGYCYGAYPEAVREDLDLRKALEAML